MPDVEEEEEAEPTRVLQTQELGGTMSEFQAQLPIRATVVVEDEEEEVEVESSREVSKGVRS